MLAAMVATVVGISAIIGARLLTRWLRHGPRPPALGDALIERRRRTRRGRASRRARYQAWLRRGVRRGWVRGLTALLGANRDNVEVAVLTGPVWLAVVAIWGGLLYVGYTSCGLRAAADGFLPLYVVVGLVLMGMMALGAAVAPAPRTVGRTDATPPLAQPAPWGARRLHARRWSRALIVWLPYAWTRVIAAGGWHVAMIGVVVFYRLVTPVARWILGRRVWRRRFGLLALAVVLLGAVVVRSSPCPPGQTCAAASAGAALTAYWRLLHVPGVRLVPALVLAVERPRQRADGAARVVDYAEFVRIKLTRDRAEVLVIAAADRGPDAPATAAVVVDPDAGLDVSAPAPAARPRRHRHSGRSSRRATAIYGVRGPRRVPRRPPDPTSARGSGERTIWICDRTCRSVVAVPPLRGGGVDDARVAHPTRLWPWKNQSTPPRAPAYTRRPRAPGRTGPRRGLLGHEHVADLAVKAISASPSPSFLSATAPEMPRPSTLTIASSATTCWIIRLSIASLSKSRGLTR
ncbi:MAG: hypothetical protein IPL61_38440 [Myxococcales bacterium]|nr:hypothetical protein [Myxococcales bacterium]